MGRDDNGNRVEYWEGLNNVPCWCPDAEYRRKLKTTTIAGVEFPLPYKGRIIEGVTYYYADIGHTGYAVHRIKNDGDDFKSAMLVILSMSGNIFLHEEEAEMRVKALRKLDKKILGGN